MEIKPSKREKKQIGYILVSCISNLNQTVSQTQIKTIFLINKLQYPVMTNYASKIMSFYSL